MDSYTCVISICETIKFYNKCRTNAQFAYIINGSTVALDDLLGDVKTKTSAADLAHIRGINLAKLSKHPVLGAFWNANSFVLN